MPQYPTAEIRTCQAVKTHTGMTRSDLEGQHGICALLLRQTAESGLKPFPTVVSQFIVLYVRRASDCDRLYGDSLAYCDGTGDEQPQPSRLSSTANYAALIKIGESSLFESSKQADLFRGSQGGLGANTAAWQTGLASIRSRGVASCGCTCGCVTSRSFSI